MDTHGGNFGQMNEICMVAVGLPGERFRSRWGKERVVRISAI
jgi:hypothetical protein